MNKYSGLSTLSTIFSFLGTLFIVIGIVLAVIGLIAFVGLGVWIASGLSLSISGLFLLSAGQAMRALIDIALQTAPIAELASNSAKMVAFFERMSGKSEEPAGSETYTETESEGYKWRQYPDGHVEAWMGNHWMRFKDAQEFGTYASQRKHRPR